MIVYASIKGATHYPFYLAKSFVRFSSLKFIREILHVFVIRDNYQGRAGVCCEIEFQEVETISIKMATKPIRFSVSSTYVTTAKDTINSFI